MIRPREEFGVQLKDLRRSEERQFVGGRDFRLDFRGISESLLLQMTPAMEDLLRIAATVYFIDRLVKRDRRSGPSNWARQIACSIAVREPEFWNHSPVHDLVKQCVGFVSGDEWSFEFQPDRSAKPHRPRGLFSTTDLFDSPPVASLYSGGLDSAAGLACRLSSSVRKPHLPIVVRHRSDIARNATLQLGKLSDHFGVKLNPVVPVMSMIPPKKLVAHEELSQRARGFLFVSVGGVIAGTTGANELELYESGIGAVNAPLLAGMEGSQATRGTHPRFLKLMSQLLGLVFGRQIDVTLPFLESTKGDVVKHLCGNALSEVARQTVSCAHFPVRLEKGGQCRSCGVCPACLFRRVALNTAGIHEDRSRYQHDLLDPRTSQLGPKKLRYLLAYLRQVDSLSELDEGHLPLLISRHLRSTGLAQPGDPLNSYVELYHRYRSEWYELIGKARTNGCRWATRIDIPDQVA